MRLRHIEVFHAVFTAGSITAAAKLLNVSQPSVSKVLAHAEQQLGFALFDRRKGKVIPTQEAERLISHVTDAYDNINELRRVSENLRARDEGQVRIAMTPALGIDLVPSAIASYLHQHPETTFETESLHHRQIVRALKELRIDVGVAFDPPVTAGIHSDHLGSAEFVALTPLPLNFGGKKRLALEDLAGLPFVSLGTRSPLGTRLASRMESSATGFRTVAHVETYQMAKALVSHGVGVAIVDEITARSSGHDNVKARRLDPPLRFNVAVMHVESAPLSIISQRFVKHLKSEVAGFLQPAGNAGT
jgi:DNA-binding transcriptional LysR family regulator